MGVRDGLMCSAPVAFDPRTNRWTLTHDFSHTVGDWHFTVSAGFTFDLASVPRAVWRWIGPHELSIEAALLHDHLYRCGGKPLRGECYPNRWFTRAEVDRLFLLEMECRGVAPWRRRLAYAAVRVFGWRFWRG